jgi:hypothetical protein
MIRLPCPTWRRSRGIAVALATAIASSCAPKAASTSNADAVPARLDSLIRRDLLSYFANDGRGVTRVEYQLLRLDPTVTGIAYPKYYVWVTATDSLGLTLREGAVRLALVDSLVEITHFLPRAYMNRVPASIDSVFPTAVALEVRKRL